MKTSFKQNGATFKQILSALVLAALAVPAAQAAVYYVSTTGNDNNNGTSLSMPWRTINKAAQTMFAGDTVYIRGGTYRESVSGAERQWHQQPDHLLSL